MPAQNRSPPTILRRVAIERSWSWSWITHFKTSSIIWSMRISDCWISVCLNPNHLYVDCCLFHGFQLPDSSESSETTLDPESQLLNGSGVVTRETDSRFPKTKWPVQPGMIHVFKVFLLSLVRFSEFGVQNVNVDKKEKKWIVLKSFVCLVHGQFFLVLLSINQSRGFASTQSLHSPSTETKVFSGHAPQAKPSLPLEQFPGKPPARSAGKWSCSWYCKEQTLLTKV